MHSRAILDKHVLGEDVLVQWCLLCLMWKNVTGCHNIRQRLLCLKGKKSTLKIWTFSLHIRKIYCLFLADLQLQRTDLFIIYSYSIFGLFSTLLPMSFCSFTWHEAVLLYGSQPCALASDCLENDFSYCACCIDADLSAWREFEKKSQTCYC